MIRPTTLPAAGCAVCDGLPATTFVVDRLGSGEWQLVSISGGVAALLGDAADALRHDPAAALRWVHPADRDDLAAVLQRGVAAREPLDREFRILVPPPPPPPAGSAAPAPADGDDDAARVIKWLRLRAGSEVLTDGRVRWIGFATDETGHQRLHEQLRQQELRFSHTARNIPGAVFRYGVRTDGTDFIEHMSPGCVDLWEVQIEDMLDDPTPAWRMVHADDLPGFVASIRESAATLTPWSYQWRITTPSGREKWLEGVGQPQRADDGTVLWDSLIFDASRRVHAELEERLTLAIQRLARHPERRFAVLFLDLDRFKLVNDSLGHHVGDELLVHVSRQLASAIRPTDMAARLGGDEFLVLIEEIDGLDDVLQVVRRVDACLRRPVVLANRSFDAPASIGVVLADGRYDSAQTLLRDADIAMYRAKADPTRCYAIFDPQMHDSMVERPEVATELRRAVHDKSFDVHYQPIIELSSGRTVAIEALVRWRATDGSMVPPSLFIAVAEEIGLIVELDDWVLARALQDLRSLQRELGPLAPRYVSVNLSALDLSNAQLPSKVLSALQAADVPPSCLQLEVTESMFLGAFEGAEQRLNQLVDQGVRISLNDFGTGYSSLAYLHRLPVDCIKADRSFVSGVDNPAVAGGILTSLWVLSQSFGIELIAEGVETSGQVTLLRAMGYELVQGYYFARPMARTELVAYLRSSPSAGRDDSSTATGG